MIGRSALAVAVLALGCVTVCPVPAVAAAAPKVVVTLKPVHALVAAIMDGVGQPALLVDGAQSPHTFALKPSGARALATADVFIRVSATVEPFTLKAVQALPPSVSSLTLVDVSGIKVLEQRHGGAFEAHAHSENANEHHGEVDGDRSRSDGHIWLDPENAKVIVDAVTKVLAARDPENAARYDANALKLRAKIAALETDLTQELAAIKDKPFIVFHDALQYFEKRFGLQAAGSITVSPEVQPSAKRLTEVRHKIAGLSAVCVFAEPGFQPALVAAVTEGSTAKAGTLDPEGIALQPSSDLYFDLMRNLANDMKKCLQPLP